MIENLWRMSIYGSVLILPVLAARLLLRKYPKEYICALWMMVLVRLLIPIFIVGSGSLQPDLQVLFAGEQSDRFIQDWQTEETAEGYDPARQTGTENGGRDTKTKQDLSSRDSYTEGMGEKSASQDFNWPFAVRALKVIYLAGMIFTGAAFWVQYVQMKKRTASAVPDGKNIWLCEEIPSAFVMGVIRPRIYLPDSLNTVERWYVVKHEEMHIRHADPWMRVAGTITLCLHWWNPVVWYGIHTMYQDMEMHCDESVMEEASTPERKTYSGILLKLSAKQSGLTGLCFGKSHTEKRIRNVLQGKKKRTIFVILFSAIFGVFCGGAFWTVPRGMENTASTEAVNEQGMNMVTKEYSIEEMPVYLERVILSDTPVNSGGMTRYVQLVMTEGEYYTEEYAGSGGGTYTENYRGTYELWVLDENRERIFRYPVQDEFGETTFNFGEDFKLELADYNGDGCVDFTLGTWGSSSMGLYYLYTLLDSGEIVSTYPEAIADIGLKFSKKFEIAEPGFVVYTYNNATGEYMRVLYQWEETQGVYMKREEQKVDMEELEMP